MREQTEFPFAFTETSAAWITLADGARLSATVRLPTTDEAVPAILEYIPYRKDDGTAVRDNQQHDYFAGHGFASVRVDIRGSGNSDGVLQGEYLATELDDAVEVIAWIADQPWCNGRVAMMGISWGGFNCLQVAAKRPPALAAVLSVASTADRYATDVHYKGGCVLGGDMLPWSATMLCFNARPPTPAIVGPRWRELWLERMQTAPVGVHDWLSHQRRNGFWKHGSVCEDYTEIDCPVMIVGGLADGYTDTVFDICAGVETETVAIVGPWSHNYPAVGVPGPNIGFLQEAVRWFTRHLSAEEPVGDTLPPFRAFVQDWTQPADYYEERAGRWQQAAAWPTNQVSDLEFWPTASELATQVPDDHDVTGRNGLGSGARQGSWWGYAEPNQLPADQRLEEPGAFRFVSAPLADDLTLVGVPELQLRLTVDQPVAQVAVRLCDRAPDDSSLQLSRGVLNLTHSLSHEHLEPVLPGEPIDVRVALDGVACMIPAGHRLELHVGTSLWPLVWPAPNDVTMTVQLGQASKLTLPLVAQSLADAQPFGEPEVAASRTTVVAPAVHERTVTDDDGRIVISDIGDHGTIRIDDSGSLMSSTATDTWTIERHDPLSARVTCERTWTIEWVTPSPKRVEVVTASQMWCDEGSFFTADTLSGFEDGVQVFTSTRDHRYDRDLV